MVACTVCLLCIVCVRVLHFMLMHVPWTLHPMRIFNLNTNMHIQHYNVTQMGVM